MTIYCILLINFILNFFLLWLGGYYKLRYRRRNLLEQGLNSTTKALKTKKYSLIEKLYLLCVYSCYYLMDIPQNLLRLMYDKKEDYKRKIDYRSAVDILVFLYASSVGAFFVSKFNSVWISGYFIWRLFVIMISKLQIVSEIGRVSGKRHEVSSFNRIIALSFLNFIELILGFSYLYFFFGVYPRIDLELTLGVLKIFVTLGIPDTFTFGCTTQKILLILQIITFIIFFVFFIANITSLKYKERLNRGKTI